MAKTYYIGIDGGGTKTKFDLFDSDKNSIASITMPTIHPAQTSFKEAVSVLTDIKEKLLEKINDSDYILKVGAGLGGYGINAEYRKNWKMNSVRFLMSLSFIRMHMRQCLVRLQEKTVFL